MVVPIVLLGITVVEFNSGQCVAVQRNKIPKKTDHCMLRDNTEDELQISTERSVC